MKIEQFYDEGLAHASYVIHSEGVVAVIDPGRDPQPYYDFAIAHDSKITTVIESHPHADFISSHFEIAQHTGATIYVSKLLGADYPHQTFDEGDEIQLGLIKLKALNTPGHSPDSISIVAEDTDGNDHAVFTGDTLFIGDVGRPDLRENAGNITATREKLARQMYHSTRNKLMTLDEDVLVYPAHGAGSLCGKNLSDDRFSTIGREIRHNYALKPMSEDAFVDILLEGQPFIPKYFGYDVDINKKGAANYETSIEAVEIIDRNSRLEEGILVIDTRPEDQYKAGHIPGAINIMDGGKFETWLGSIVGPDEKYYLIAENNDVLETVIRKAAKIGYEPNIKGALLAPDELAATTQLLNVQEFKSNPDAFQIVDIRNTSEYEEGKTFENAINIPLPELRERVGEISKDKPVVVHCAGGYRSAAGSSILEAALDSPTIFDLSYTVEDYNSETVS